MKLRDFKIANVGPALLKNPIALDPSRSFVSDEDRLLFEPHIKSLRRYQNEGQEPPSFELAGPREYIAFDPTKTRALILTCGGICPGLNDVIRGLVTQLWQRYGTRQILGGRYGYQGLGTQRLPFEALDPFKVADIHQQGGSVLGSSRGSPSVETMVDVLEAEGVDLLFTIGGDGTMRGATAIAQEIKKRGLKLGIVGVPKTIDNDIPFVRRSFGFETAVALAAKAIQSAHNEARSVMKGIGLVKLMGRHSGYLAATTTMATGNVQICLIPEIPFHLEGPRGLLAQIENSFKHSDHCVIVVAEGAGQKYFDELPAEYDSSGNRRLGDIGIWLRDKINAHFKGLGINAPVRYIDPSYQIRAQAAHSGDGFFCAQLAQNAVHAAMAGKTAMLIGHWHGQQTHIPMEALKDEKRCIDPHGNLWSSVLETTGQWAVLPQGS